MTKHRENRPALTLIQGGGEDSAGPESTEARVARLHAEAYKLLRAERRGLKGGR